MNLFHKFGRNLDQRLDSYVIIYLHIPAETSNDSFLERCIIIQFIVRFIIWFLYNPRHMNIFSIISNSAIRAFSNMNHNTTH